MRVERTPDGLLIRPARRRPWWMFVMPPWIAFIVGLGLVTMLTGEPPENSGGNAFLVFWSLFGGALFALSLYGVVHGEELVLTPIRLHHTRRLGPFPRGRAYERASIADVRVSPDGSSAFDPRAGLRQFGIGSGFVAFDYGDRTIRVADVEEAEAERVVAALRGEGL